MVLFRRGMRDLKAWTAVVVMVVGCDGGNASEGDPATYGSQPEPVPSDSGAMPIASMPVAPMPVAPSSSSTANDAPVPAQVPVVPQPTVAASGASGSMGTGGTPPSPQGTAGGLSEGGAPALGSGGNPTQAGGAGMAGAGGLGAAGQPDVGAGGSAGSGAGVARSECPEAPPAAQKDPAPDRNLVLSKDEYRQMLTQEAPFVGTRGQLPWHSYTPEQAASSPEQRFPLLVVLHGGYGREVEDGNIMVDVAPYLLGTQNGLLTDANRADYPTYIIFPHCRVEEGCDFGVNEWASTDGGAHFDVQAEPSVMGGTAIELIEHVIATFNVDPARVYLTGNSMGGGGSWEFAQRRPELFAAVFPVSGHMPRLDLLSTIVDAKLPVWAFGAVNDNTNPYADTVEAIDTIDSAGGCAWLTTYNNTGHDDALWSSPYLESGLWPWLFAQTNSSAPGIAARTMAPTQ
jgi:predicted esterase